MKKYSKDKKVVFYEDSHSYYLGDKRLTSITQYISKFKTPFDRDRISKEYAKKHNRKQEDVLAEWDKKAKDSTDMGSFVHKIFEDFIDGKEIETREDYPKCKVAEKIIEELFSSRLTPVATELIVYTDKYAGQIDCIAKNDKGEHFILDWKTNGKIDKSNYWQTMKGKFSQYDDCALNHYSIQLRAYQSMCKEYDIKNCFIVHLKEDSYEIIEAKKIKPF